MMMNFIVMFTLHVNYYLLQIIKFDNKICTFNIKSIKHIIKLGIFMRSCASAHQYMRTEDDSQESIFARSYVYDTSLTTVVRLKQARIPQSALQKIT